MPRTSVDKKDIYKLFDSNKVGLFTTKGSCTEAIDYAQQMFCKDDEARVTQALLIYHNTLLAELSREVHKMD
jgi:hypothetical protein